MYIRPYEQEGAGLGDIFRSFFSRRNPIFTNVGKFVKDTELDPGGSSTEENYGRSLLYRSSAGRLQKVRFGDEALQCQERYSGRWLQEVSLYPVQYRVG